MTSKPLTDEQIDEAIRQCDFIDRSGVAPQVNGLALRLARDLKTCRDALRGCISDFEFIMLVDKSADFRVSILKARVALGEIDAPQGRKDLAHEHLERTPHISRHQAAAG